MSCEIMQNLLLLITYDTSLPSAYLLQYSSYLLSNDGLPPFSIPQTNLVTSIQTFTYLPPKENCGMYHVYWPLPCFQISTLPKQYNCNRYVKLQYV